MQSKWLPLAFIVHFWIITPAPKLHFYTKWLLCSFLLDASWRITMSCALEREESIISWAVPLRWNTDFMYSINLTELSWGWGAIWHNSENRIVEGESETSAQCHILIWPKDSRIEKLLKCVRALPFLHNQQWTTLEMWPQSPGCPQIHFLPPEQWVCYFKTESQKGILFLAFLSRILSTTPHSYCWRKLRGRVFLHPLGLMFLSPTNSRYTITKTSILSPGHFWASTATVDPCISTKKLFPETGLPCR